MKNSLPFIVIGLATGSVYALAAMGLVVTYTTSGVFNFAHGAVAMAAAFVFYSLRVDYGWPTWRAVAVAVLVAGPAIGIIIDRVLLPRPNEGATSAYDGGSLRPTVGLQGLATCPLGRAPRTMRLQ